MTSITQTPSLGSLIIVLTAALCMLIKNRRNKQKRIGYSWTEKWALFNIVTIGLSTAYFLSVPFLNWVRIPFDTLPWELQNLGIILMMVPIIIYMSIITYGKKDENIVVVQ